jgi:hypothetical protein
LGFVHPITKPPQDALVLCDSVPQACKNRVYIFLFQGVDPLDVGNLDGLCDYLHSLGFIKTYCGMPYHVSYFAKETRRIHEKEPTSRFVVMGFGCGAPVARELTCKLEKADIPVDLLVYLDGVSFDHETLDQPANACHVVHVVAGKRKDENEIVEGDYIECESAWRAGTPTHPATLKMLARELPVVAQRVPVIDFQPDSIDLIPPRRPVLPVLPPPLPGVPVLPPPKPGTPVLPPPKPAETRGDWEFLAPDGNSVGVQGRQPMQEATTAVSGETR